MSKQRSKRTKVRGLRVLAKKENQPNQGLSLSHHVVCFFMLKHLVLYSVIYYILTIIIQIMRGARETSFIII